MIKAVDLVKDFGKRRAVDGVSFEVEKGTVLGFLGPNGAGKTTTIRMVAGFLPPTEGNVFVKGINVASDPVAAQKSIGYMPETTPLYEDMTVSGFLRFLAEVRGFSGTERNSRVERAIERCFLHPVRNQTIDTLSKGYRQRTCLAQTLLHDPDILLLDEPTEGLDPNQKQVVRDMIKEMASERVVMLSTHVLEEVEAICTRAIIISAGKVVADDTPAALKARSPKYNAVTLTAEGEGIADKLGKLPGVKEVHALEDGKIVAFPKAGKSIAADVLGTAQQNQWKVSDIKVDEGRLDDVFRQITSTEDSKKKEVA
ncbi:putative ABC transporter ATP-binding protein YbhF [Pontiella desulfatans]|uniref:Putative ABC transporter ATP-binding protein YbhF n=1 Tax=Pontiella desulfatans TaxID=2750659 RepID=A0A6C2U8U0_PONDE|nr:ATP-binding cassette domain-containing protein [Pontiella desulfatans]VGO16480.1 putative ABC transporter ATP-binding protein YbhF [Pontiella desulfatans]